MNVDLKDGELALIDDAILSDIKSRLVNLSASKIEYHIDLDEVASKLRMVQMMITIENKLWKCREHLADSEGDL
jgi:hypothetical protein